LAAHERKFLILFIPVADQIVKSPFKKYKSASKVVIWQESVFM